MISRIYNKELLYQYYKKYAEHNTNHLILSKLDFNEKIIENKVLMVSEEESIIHGFISSSIVEEKAYITLLYGDASHKKELLQALEETLLQINVTEIWIHFFNPVSIPFYPIEDRIHPGIQGVEYPSNDYELYKVLGYEDNSLQHTYYQSLMKYKDDFILYPSKEITIELYNKEKHRGLSEFAGKIGSKGWEREILKNQEKENPLDLLLALDQGKVIAFAGPLDCSESGRGYFAGIAVLKEYQGRKIGLYLFHSLCRTLKEMGASYMTLFTGDLNKAKYIYEKAGFTKVSSQMTMKKTIGRDKMYHIINEKDLNEMIQIVGKENVKFRDEIEKDVAHDELKTVFHYPEIHVTVTQKEDVALIMKYANKHKISVTVRGSGTGLVGACVPVEGGILLDTRKLNKILELDKTNLTLRVQPGVLLMDIYEYVEKEGLFYAPDPGEKSATIGGNIATNAGGMRAVKYGVTRDWVRGLEVVLANGEVIQTGGKVVKDSSGYSLKNLIIGSEGTLGIVTEAILKLIPKPQEQVSLLIPFENRNDAISAVPAVITSHSLPTAVEFLEKASLRFSEEFLGKKIPNASFEAYLLVSYDGNTKLEVENDITVISDLCVNELGAIDAYLVDTDERKESVWSARGAFLEAIKSSTTEMDECDVVLPRSNIKEYLQFTDEVSKELDIRIPYFGHAGDGNLHIYFCKDDLSDDLWKEKLDKGFTLMYEKAFEMDGMVSGEHGIGFAKKSYLRKQVGETQMNIMQGIKTVFDPNDILNPGKIV